MALHCLLIYLTDIKINTLLVDPETSVDRVDKCTHIVDIVINQRNEGDRAEDGIANECR